jgi:hypothetical protein
LQAALILALAATVIAPLPTAASAGADPVFFCSRVRAAQLACVLRQAFRVLIALLRLLIEVKILVLVAAVHGPVKISSAR